MSWKKYFSVSSNKGDFSEVPAQIAAYNAQHASSSGTSSKYSSYLPEVYAGHPNRIQRYYQYEDMDRDSDITAALDTIADFCTQSEEQNDAPFKIKFNEEGNETEVELLNRYLTKWIKLNTFKSRLFEIFRNTIKNGDAFFLRDPETKEWLWMDHFNVEMVRVDEESGNTPKEYFVRGFEYNKEAKFATKKADLSQYRTPFGVTSTQGSKPMAAAGTGSFQMQGGQRDPRQLKMAAQGNDLFVVDADHVIHLSLSVGMDINWPFGKSVLESVFKTFKQKELLEDSIIIYRVQRAPERRVFYIDVGSMAPAKARAHLDQIKNEIHQRRIPNQTGGGSSVLDAAYNPLCLDMATRIPLLDGRTLSIEELAIEYRDGKENWVYSCDPVTGAVVPGNITWAGVTKKDAEVIRLHLDNGETITCTPDHKFPVLGKGFVEAQNLTHSDSLVAFNTREQAMSTSSADRTYTQVYDHEQKSWVFTHRMVGEYFRKMGKHQEFTFLPENVNAVRQTIHHVDYDRYNNDPRNLTYMNKEDHIAYHVFKKKDYWQNITPTESLRIRTKISNGLKAYFAGMSDDDKKSFSEFSSDRNRKWITEMKINDPEKFARARSLKRVANGHNAYKNQSLIISQRMIQIIVDMVKAEKPTRIAAAAKLTNNVEFMQELREVNPPLAGHANKIDYDNVSPVKLDLIMEKSGYDGWKDFTRKTSFYNHRVVKIERDIEPMDVGTITVDGQEKWNSFHTFATESGIFAKNSIIEDYFFAQTAEGRGSKVETLAGGDNLGEIGDLSFFSKKLARGLRIPTSYLSLGDDESGQGSYNDGKLGAALIQEFRFNKYCMRLQGLLAPVFDSEFKRFLKDNGVFVESGIYELEFNPPQNFTKYRQIEIDQAQASVYQMLSDNKKLAERFKLQRFLGLTENELLTNEKQWSEENAAKLKKATGVSTAESMETDLSSIGIRPPGDDFGMEPSPDGDMPSDGMDGPGGPPPGGPPGGGAPPGDEAPPI